MISRILIGVDDSKYADHAAGYGFTLARKFNAHVGLVNIIEPAIMPQSITPGDPVLGAYPQTTGVEELEIMDVQNTQSDNIIERIIAKYGNELQVTHFNEYGSTADGILNCSKEFNADLVVVGTHEKGMFDRLFSGSVAEDVVRHSAVPVLVVPLSS